jgi:hypothetical protein
MGPFAAALAGFKTTVETRSNAVFVGSVVALRDSVKYGSAETGAPAMPVAPNEFPRAGALRDSVIATYPDQHTALIYTDKPYAPDVEDNTKGHTFNNGGPNGWKLTIAAGVRVIENVAKRIAGYR